MDNTRKITSEVIEDIPVIVFEGDLTSDADSEVMKIYSSTKDQYSPDKLIINFEKTNYINSAGIAILINIIQDLGETKGRVIFVGLSNHFLKVMDIVGISDFVDIYNSNSEAIANIKK